MRRAALLLIFGWLAVAAMLRPWDSQQLRAESNSQAKVDAQKSAPAKQGSTELKLKVGDTAPNFTLLAFDGKEVKPVSLRDYEGKKNVALAFYVFAFTPG